MKEGGYSLVELMVVVVIIGIVAVAAVPQYTRTVERARCDQCTETLHSIWSAQRMHRLERGVYASSLKELAADGWIDSTVLRTDAPFGYSLTGSAYAFLVEAERRPPGWRGTFTIDEEGSLAGYVEDAGGKRVLP